MKRLFAIITAAMVLCTMADAKGKKEVTYNENGEIIKTGINLGPLPVVAFDADRGFQFGALLNLYNFGDGKNYPNPNEQWYFEASAYTKESAINSYKFIVNYDNKTLIPGVRMSICSGYYKDAALDFYGFNGYQSNYDMSMLEPTFAWEDSKAGEKLENKFINKGKLPKGFYRFGRDLIKAKVDFTGEIAKNFYWEAGYHFQWLKAQSFSPKGYAVMANPTDADMFIPRAELDGQDGTTLFDLYKAWGIIPEDQANGGLTSSIRLGLMYDSRNVENNPTKGIWAEAHISAAPKFLGTTHPHYKFSATMRQYLPLAGDKLVFAYRAAYEGFMGDAPWYMLPFYDSMEPKADFDGFGGYRTVRGLMLNRVQGLQTGFYNAELRWRFVIFTLGTQNIAFALSGFTDGAHVFKGYDLTNKTGEYKELYQKFVNTSKKDGFHGSAGAGLRFIMNQNFIVAFEYAKCFNQQDGNNAFYINIGFLF